MHNPLLLQPLGHWFTLISRKHEHLAVGSSGRGLTDSRGSTLFRGCLTLAFCTLIVSHFKGFVKNFFEEFLFHLCRLGICCSSFLTPLLYHTLGDLSRGNFRGCSAFCYSPVSSLGRASSAFPLAWLRFPLPLPLTLQIIAHLPTECNRWNAQNWDFYFLKLCATFLLTKCWRCVIMEISRAWVVGARLKKSIKKDDRLSSRL